MMMTMIFVALCGCGCLCSVAGQMSEEHAEATFTRCQVTLTHRRPTALPRSRSHRVECGSEALPWLVKVASMDFPDFRAYPFFYFLVVLFSTFLSRDAMHPRY